MRIENDKCRYLEIKNCVFNIFGWCIIKLKSTFVELNCGGKGFAAVLHTGGYRVGYSGAGLGY
jgi:hypothetical protein